MKYRKKEKIVHIALIDTGCSLVHPLFNNVICNRVCVEGITDVTDRCGHGTFSLSIIVRSMKAFADITYKVTSIKVSEQGVIDINILIKGLEYCNQINPDVIYIGSCNCSFQPKMASVLNDLAKKGILIVVPSGNYAFCEPMYPACLETTLSCGLANEDGTVCTKANIYKTDVFVKSTNFWGVLTEECAQSMGVKQNSEGLCCLVATSFAAAEMAAFALVIKAYWHDMNVYMLRYLIIEKCIDLVIQDFQKLFIEIEKESIDNKFKKINKDIKYIFLDTPKDLDIQKKWKFSLYTYEGILDTCSGSLNFELYNDERMKHKIYEDKILFYGGRGDIPIPKLELEPGIYMMKIGNKVEGIESDISVMILRPQKPKIVCKNGMVFVGTGGNNIKILYTEDGNIPEITTGDNISGTTKIYTEPVMQKKEIMIFCAYCNNVFSEPIILKKDNGGEKYGA